jgi:hypothetical protein
MGASLEGINMHKKFLLAAALVVLVAGTALATLAPWEIMTLNLARNDSLEATSELNQLLGEPELDPNAVPYVLDAINLVQQSRDLIDSVLAAG